MKSFKLMCTVLTGLALLTGCGMANGGNGADDNNLQTQNVGYNNNGENDLNGNENDIGDNGLFGDNENDGDNGLFNDDGNNGQQRMEVADQAANKVKGLKEVQEANVIVTDNNAFVAVMLKDNAEGEVTKQIEKKISNAVKEADQDIENVYVSSNPDFVDRMRNYGNDIQDGDPVEGLFEEFSEMTRRVFPNAR
ncbi:YhcN/YlaJ family sporulation lipoprotein [Bacillus sp. SG-1]|uniref:YhcN/YlaJ family sporulation lipoprotein n=1 Tax=Bacillus sp. SG-1 TaxID=161544 RepID=UPI0002E5A458|nr:YhcN/YlaJ family sporulation lipoprotein [Bacillus sp. SG-1]